MPESVPRPDRPRPGIQSVEVAASILEALAEAPAAAPLKSLAAAASMPPAKVHRYLVSLTRSGLVEQDPVTGHYGIGRLSLTLELKALGWVDVVRLASDAMPALRDRIDETVVLTVWGDEGPTIVRFEESRHPVTLNVRVGSVLPILTTALGRVYATFARSPQIRDAVEIARSRSTGGEEAMSEATLESILGEVRARGLARIAGDQLPGVSALAAPIFDHQGDLAGVMGALGRQESFDDDWDGGVAIAIRESASCVSSRMGFAG